MSYHVCVWVGALRTALVTYFWSGWQEKAMSSTRVSKAHTNSCPQHNTLTPAVVQLQQATHNCSAMSLTATSVPQGDKPWIS